MIVHKFGKLLIFVFIMFLISIQSSLTTISNAQSTPILNVSPTELRLEIQEGEINPDFPSITVANAGDSRMNFEVTDDADWLFVDNSGVLEEGSSIEVVLLFSLFGLPPGEHLATITVTAEGAQNSPVQVLFTLVIIPEGPRIINVPRDFGTLAEALEQSRDGDTIEIEPGTYRDVALVITKSIQLRGSSAGAVILQGNGQDAVLRVSGNATGVGIENLDVVGGNIGIWIKDKTQATVSNSVIRENIGRGVIVSEQALAVIQKSTIRNTSRTSDQQQGEGVLAVDQAQIAIEESEIRDNGSVGIFLTNRSQSFIRNNSIIDNEGRGIQIFEDVVATFEDNLIMGNRDVALFAINNANVTIKNNTITNTRSNADGNFGRGIGLRHSVQAIVENNTISNNREAGIATGEDVNATIFSNTISDNDEDGIFVGYVTENETAKVEISENEIMNNIECGVQVDSNEPDIQVMGADNKIVNNNPDLCDGGEKLPSGFRKFVIASATDLVLTQVIRGPQEVLHTVRLSPDGQLLVASFVDRTTRLWDFQSARTFFLVENETIGENEIEFSPTGQKLAINTSDGIRLIDPNSRRTTRIIEPRVEAIAFSRDGKFLAGTLNGRITHVWDTASGELISSLEIGGRMVDFHPSGDWLALAIDPIGSPDGILLWNIFTNETRFTNAGSRFVKFSRDGSLLATVSNDKFVILDFDSLDKVFDVGRFRSGNRFSLDFSSDGQTLLAMPFYHSGPTIQNVMVWNIQMQQMIGEISVPTVRSLDISEDSRTFATGSEDGIIRIWRAKDLVPDEDNDGVGDSLDLCPGITGTPATDGC